MTEPGRSGSGLVLISDGWPGANMAGISQTLFNLLEDYPGRLWMLMPVKETIPTDPRLAMEELRYPTGPFKLMNNRLGNWLNEGQLKRQLGWRERKWKLPEGMPSAKEAFVMVSTTDPSKLQVSWLLFKKGYKVVPYFMDDWLGGSQLKWKGGSVQEVASSLLSNAPCRLMISRNLDETLIKRYQLDKRPTLIIHNPSPVVKDNLEKTLIKNKDEQLSAKSDLANSVQIAIGIRQLKSDIVYAGSIWPMHLDALVAVAKAVQLLALRQACLPAKQAHHDNPEAQKSCQAEPVEARKSRDKSCQAEALEAQSNVNKQYRLIIYTSEAAWKHNRKALEGPGVEYGGFIPYAEMQEKLAEGWLLLATASFEEKWASFTNSSVQTKLTDYMAAGKPILFVGPLEGASGQFVHEWDCGFSIGTSKPGEISEQLEAIAALPDLSRRKAENGLNASRGYFRKEAVQGRLYKFLEEHVPSMPVGTTK